VYHISSQLCDGVKDATERMEKQIRALIDWLDGVANLLFRDVLLVHPPPEVVREWRIDEAAQPFGIAPITSVS
jgi:hypothetical protein